MIASSPLDSTTIFLPVYPVGFVDAAISFDRVPLSIDSRSSPPNTVKIIPFLLLLSLPFSTNLCNFRRSHDIDVVNRYSDFAISLTMTTDFGRLEGVGYVNGTVEDVGDPMLGNVIGDDSIPSVGIGDVTILCVEVEC